MCLVSVAGRTYRPIEILVADDGFTDRSATKVLQLLAKYDDPVQMKFVQLPLSDVPAVVRNSAMRNLTAESRT